MELFLNFVWLLLFVPAWCVWRRNGRSFSSARCFLTLACVLVILFPVISATDDLHAAPQAMEESSATKRSTLKGGDLGKEQHPVEYAPALVMAAAAFVPMQQLIARVHDVFLSPPFGSHAHTIAQRAPPSFFLA